MNKERKTHKIRVLGRRITIRTETHPDRTPPQTTFSMKGTLRGVPVKEANWGGVFVGTKNGKFLEETRERLEDMIENPQNWKPKFETS
jgi:hypothetical protein